MTNTPLVASSATPSRTPTLVPTPTASVTASVTPTAVGGCAGSPLLSCALAGKAVFSLKRGVDPSRSQFSFQWLRGTEAVAADFANPTTSTEYDLCIYDSTGLRSALTLPAGGTCGDRPCWNILGQPDSVKGYRYRDRNGTNDGVQGALLRSGVWQRRQPLVKKALSKFKAPRLKTLLAEAARVDAALKGVFPAEPWTTLTDLLVALLRPPESARAR